MALRSLGIFRPLHRRSSITIDGPFGRSATPRPQTLPKGSAVSQNNVAKEAGCEPSALRKRRYPALIAEIQRWLATNRPQAPVSERQTLLSQRKRNGSFKERIEDMKAQRDSLAFDA
jgi:hypothetical protein